jgi:hypothetical protein
MDLISGLVRHTPSFIVQGINQEKNQIAGRVIHGIGDTAESRVRAKAHSTAHRLLPTMAEASVDRFMDKHIHSARQKGEALARAEVSKINL